MWHSLLRRLLHLGRVCSSTGPGPRPVHSRPVASSLLLELLEDRYLPSHGGLSPALVQFLQSSYPVAESAGRAAVVVTRTGNTHARITVDYATADGSARAGTDYSARHGTLVFNPGETSKTVLIPLLEDGAPAAGDETFNLVLSHPQGASLGAHKNAVVKIHETDFGRLQFSAPTYTVNQADGAQATITVTRIGGSDGTVAVHYVVANGTARAGATDHPMKGTLVFAPGVTSETFTIPVRNDRNSGKGEQTVNLSLNSPTGGAVLGSRSRSVLQIHETAAGQTFQFSAPAYTVDEMGNTSATITVKRSGSTQGTASVSYATANGTASAGRDYKAVHGTLVFGPGVATRTFTVPVLDDGDSGEGDETVKLALSSPTNHAALGQQRTAVLTLHETAAGQTFQFSAPTYTTDEVGHTSANITVTRSGGSDGRATVDYATSNGTARGGSDYKTAHGTLVFAPGVTTQTFAVPVLGAGGSGKGDETVKLSLSSPTNHATLGKQRTAVLTLHRTAAGQTFQFNTPTYTVDEAGNISATITVTRTGSNGAASVNYTTADGTAKAGTDYTAVSGTLTFNPGETRKTFIVPVLDDGDSGEGDETVKLALSSPTNHAALGQQRTAVLTLHETAAGQTFQFSAPTYTQDEAGNTSATIIVTRSGGSDGTVTIQYSTSDSTAKAGTDYTAASGTLTFNPGETTKTFTVPVLDDGDSGEGDETINLALSNPTNQAALGPQRTAVLTLHETAAGQTFQFNSPTYTQDEAGNTSATITVTRSGSDGTASVSYTTADGTAKAGTDYTAASGTLTFHPGETSKTFTVPVLDDGDSGEGDETVNLSLSGPTPGATLGAQNSAVLTVHEANFGQLQFSTPSYTVNEVGTAAATITVTRSGGSDGTVTVQYSTSDGTAKAGTDYTAVSGTLTFNPGDTSKTFTVPVLDDGGADTQDKTVNLALSNPQSGATLGDQLAAVLTLHEVPTPG